MEKRFLLFVFLFLGGTIFAQEGVYFQKIPFANALAKAKMENKFVFVDCYLDVCVPCKKMDREVFSQKEAGDFFNTHCVNVKYNMSKGEGNELRESYGITLFPTYLLFRPDGSLLYRTGGFVPIKNFIADIELAINKSNLLAELKERFDAGKIKKKELAVYFQALREVNDDSQGDEVYNELKKRIMARDKLKPEYWPYFTHSSCLPGTEDFNLILSHIPIFEKNIGKEKLDDYLYNSYVIALRFAKSFSKFSPAELKREIAKLDITRKAELLDYATLVEYILQKDAGKMLDFFSKKAETAPFAELQLCIRTSLSAFRSFFNKSELMELVTILEKVNARLENADEMEFIQTFIDCYKKMACDGVVFENLTLDEALAKASNNRQYVFLDCYGTYCHSCKYMSEHVFTQKEVGDYMDRFICLKFNMDENKKLREQLKVIGYPTYIIFDDKGNEIHRFVDKHEADEFIQEVGKVFKKTIQ